MNNYINENYTVVWKHSESTPQDWNIFLLIENHYHKLARKVNGLFISLFATPGSFFVVEGSSYLQQSKTPKHNMRTFSIETSHIQPSNVLGWDNVHFLTAKENFILAYTVASGYFNTFYNNLDLLLQINWKSILEEHLLTIDYEFQDELDFKPFLEKAICEVANEMNVFVEQQLVPIIAQYVFLIEQIKLDEEKHIEMQSYFDFQISSNSSIRNPFEIIEPCFRPLEKYTTEDYINLSSDLHKKRVEALKMENFLETLLHQKRLELMDKKNPYSVADFPERTQGMIKTLNHISQLVSNSESIAFLIAGENHLNENTSMPQERRELCSLEPLYRFFANHKNIVVLKPKSLS